MPLVINAFGDRHTDTQTDTNTSMQTKAISRNQVCVAKGRVRLVKMHIYEILSHLVALGL